MNYPTMKEVEEADHEQLCQWHRFLKSPGYSALGEPGFNFAKLVTKQVFILDRIEERLHELGGFTPEISKLIGWKE